MKITKVEAYLTEDGKYHPSLELARMHIAFEKLADLLQDNGGDPYAILNRLSSNISDVVEWVDSIKAAEAWSLRPRGGKVI